MKDKFMESEFKERDYQQAIQPLMQLIREQGITLEDIRKDIQPMLDTFNNLRWGERILVKIGIFLGGLAGFVWTVLQIIKIFIGLKK